MAERICIVEDDSSIRELIRCALNSHGFEVFAYPTGEDMFLELEKISPQLFLLDIMLPGMDGMEILITLRQNSKTSHLPVIMLTSKSSEIDKVIGLDSGANDYITKPFGILELVARVRAALRSSIKDTSPTLSCGSIIMNTETHTVTSSGLKIELTLKEFELLRTLLINAGKVMARDRLLNEVWGFNFSGETRTLDMHIRTLRQKLGDDAENPKFIKTIRGIGYTFSYTE